MSTKTKLERQKHAAGKLVEVCGEMDIYVRETALLEGDEKPSGLFTRTPAAVGRMIMKWHDAGARVPESTWASIQTGKNTHEEGLGIVAKINHSCDPTVFIDTRLRIVIAYKELKVCDELTYFYPSTEFISSKALVCRCGARECIGLYGGAKYLTVAQLERYRLNDHIVAMVGDSIRSI